MLLKTGTKWEKNRPNQPGTTAGISRGHMPSRKRYAEPVRRVNTTLYEQTKNADNTPTCTAAILHVLSLCRNLLRSYRKLWWLPFSGDWPLGYFNDADLDELLAGF